ncbi:acyltransferase 3, partial [Colletotrichum godetiae]
KLGHTAYLDGLRGVAAFVVYIFHYSYLWFPDLRWGYGVEDHHMFWQMPIIRALHSGRASVTVFFVISGFVLTLKTLTMIHNRKVDQALSVLAGSAFRRPLRLYLPIFASTFIIALLVYWGNYMRDPSGAPIPPRGQTLTEQLRHWFWSSINLSNPFRPIINRENMGGSEYDGHLWTIPVEFKGSLLVFFLLLIFARTKRWIHLVGVMGTAFWLVRIGDWDQSLFCIGLLLAEISIILPNSSLSSEAAEHETLGYGNAITTEFGLKIIYIFRHAGTLALFFLGLHLFSYPEYYGSSTPGFITISQWVPAYYQATSDRTQLFWNSIGAVIFVFALMFEPLLQRPFTTSFAQYLGRISYSLYLWHGAINHIIGVRWLSPAYSALQLAQTQAQTLTEGGNEAAAIDLMQTAWSAYRLAFLYGTLVNTVALLWASDVFNALVDVNAVKLTRWFGEK